MSADPYQCKHPKVQMVSHQEDAEFVECLECGDIFEASELKDIRREAEAEAAAEAARQKNAEA